MKSLPLITRAIVLVAALALLGTGQAWALDTPANTLISNTAEVTFTINAKTTSVTSDPADFRVDRKIRPVVANQDGGNVMVLAGASDFVSEFLLTNESNTAAGSDLFYLTMQQDNTDFTPTNVRVYADDGGTPGSWDATDTELTGDARVVSLSNVSGSNSATYFIVADIPDNAVTQTAGKFASVHLIATAWNGATVAAGALPKDPDTNDATLSEVVYADDAGSATSDDAYEGQHSDSGTFETETPVTITKAAGNGTSGYHIPGDVVTYTVSVVNNAGSAASAVTIYDEIPTNLTFNATTLSCPDVTFTPEWSSSARGTAQGSIVWVAVEPATVYHVRCYDGDVAAGATATMTFAVTID